MSARGPCFTGDHRYFQDWSVNIHKFIVPATQLDDLIALGTLTLAVGWFLDATVTSGLNVRVSGGTHAGKTTLVA